MKVEGTGLHRLPTGAILVTGSRVHRDQRQPCNHVRESYVSLSEPPPEEEADLILIIDALSMSSSDGAARRLLSSRPSRALSWVILSQTWHRRTHRAAPAIGRRHLARRAWRRMRLNGARDDQPQVASALSFRDEPNPPRCPCLPRSARGPLQCWPTRQPIPSICAALCRPLIPAATSLIRPPSAHRNVKSA